MEGEAVSVEQQPTALVDKAYNSLSTNPYFNAGAGLVGIGLGVSLMRRSAVILNAIFRRRYVISLELSNEDVAYPWLLGYINKYGKAQSRHLSVRTTLHQSESGRTELNYNFMPGHGVHYIRYNYRWIQVDRQREDQSIQRDGIRVPFETVTLTTLGTNVLFLKKILDEATNEALANAETGLVIYKAVGPEWRRLGAPKRKRPIDSVILDIGMAEEILADFSDFCASAQWYTERGIPYRRGYLFYGPPGSGKSSFISSLASHFGYSICMLSLSERTLDDDRLNHLLNTPPPNSIVVLEDIDAAFMPQIDSKQSRTMYEGLTRVSFSGLLNAIDGVACAEERILFMTTNHIDRLDPALIRPGRVDVKQYFGNCTDAMLVKMFRRFYGDKVKDDMAIRFQKAALSVSSSLSPAQVQGHLLFHKNNPLTAIDNIINICDSNLR